jgi:RNA polymerase sigma factor (sigma-70 family)
VSNLDLRSLQRLEGPAWNAAWDRLAPKARKVASKKLHGPLSHVIEDVVAETLEGIMRSIAKIEQPEELERLTVIIANRRVIDHHRKEYYSDGTKRSAPVEASPDIPDLASPDLLAQEKELAQLIGELLKEIKPLHREMLYDFYLCGHSYAEIAQKHGLAVSTVGVYLVRALEQCRTSINKYPGLLKEKSDMPRLLERTVIFLIAIS